MEIRSRLFYLEVHSFIFHVSSHFIINTIQPIDLHILFAELQLYFTNDTPILNVDHVRAVFNSNRPDAKLDIQCHLTHFDHYKTDCKFVAV